MKRISFLVLFFYCCSFVNPPQSRAVAPLAVLAPAAIGAAVVAIAGTQYALRGDHSANSYQSDGRNLTVPLVAYKKMAVQGGEILLGRSVTAVLDAKKAFDDNVLQGYGALKGLIDEYFGPSASFPLATPGDVFNFDDFLPIANSQTSFPVENSGCSGMAGRRWQVASTPAPYSTTNSQMLYSGVMCVYITANKYEVRNYMPKQIYNPSTPSWLGDYHRFTAIAVVDQPVNYPPPGVPNILPPQDIPGISNKFADAAPIRPDVAKDLDDLLKDHPEYWPISGNSGALPEPNNAISDYPPAQPISGADVNQWAQGQSAGAQQSYIDTLQSLVDANPTDANLAAELAKAQAEQTQQEAEDVQDSFDPIHSSPFRTPYTPGQFDIPARFSSFLNNVQSSGLFSFSSSFFNSLPGGGSPVYTLDAGQYGTHTVDLSETLGTGLSVLKTVLLLLFGFLSIRVVILKR